MLLVSAKTPTLATIGAYLGNHDVAIHRSSNVRTCIPTNWYNYAHPAFSGETLTWKRRDLKPGPPGENCLLYHLSCSTIWAIQLYILIFSFFLFLFSFFLSFYLSLFLFSSFLLLWFFLFLFFFLSLFFYLHLTVPLLYETFKESASRRGDIKLGGGWGCLQYEENYDRIYFIKWEW